jgi:putative ABC transport system substrate-binding protein
MLVEGLQARGHVVGDTLVFVCRNADEGEAARFRALAAELVRLKVDLIIGVSSAATRAIRPEAGTIPIVALDLETDPVASGLAVSLARPGGNITGIFLDALEMNGKRLQLLKEAVPTISRVVALWDPSMDAGPLRALETAAVSLNLRVKGIAIRSPKDFEAAFRTAAREHANGIVLIESPLMRIHQKRLVDLALQDRLPIVARDQRFAQGGGLMSYGPDVPQIFRQAVSFVDRILRGARPGDLPIERPSRFYFVVNLRTAKALGLTIPASVLARADQIIE